VQRRDRTGGAASIVASDPGDVDDVWVQGLLQLARTHLGMEIAWISRFSDGEQVIRAVSGDAAAMNMVVGAGTPLEGSFCIRVLAGTLPPVVAEARRHPVTRELTVTRDLGIGSYAGVPLHGPGGEPVGMLCCLSRTPKPDLSADAPRFLALIAELVTDHLHSAAATAAMADRGDAARIRSVLAARSVRMVFQPVVRLEDGQPLAYEALARFDGQPFPTPAHAFAAAAHAGLGTELELLAMQRALEHLDDLPTGSWLGLNLSADALVAPVVEQTLLRYADRRVGVEVTEHAQVADYDRLTATTARLRAAGIQIAVDDAGAGYSSFRHILRLHPDVIKLDLEITRNVDTDPVRQALTRSLVGFAEQVGAWLVAEGIETAGERETLQRLGVPLGQGYLFARPGPLPRPVGPGAAGGAPVTAPAGPAGPAAVAAGTTTSTRPVATS